MIPWKRASWVLFLYCSIAGRHIFSNSPVTFLDQSSSARHLSSGGAMMSDDPGQMFYNPAVLQGRIRGRTMSFSYMTGLEFSQNLISAAYAWPWLKNAFSFSFIYNGQSGLEAFDAAGVSQGAFATTELGVALSHSWKVNSFLQFGETIKYYNLDYGPANASAWAISLDAGGLITPIPGVFFGFSFSNIVNTQLQFRNEAEHLPTAVNITPGFEIMRGRARIFYNYRHYLELYDVFGLPAEHRFGMEFDVYHQYLQMRAGFDGQNVTAGIGGNLFQYNYSFAYLPSAIETRFAATFSFNMDIVGVGPFKRPDNIAQSDIEEELVEFYEGIADYNKGNYKNAYDKFTSVIRKNPDHEMATLYRDRALLHLRTSNWLDQEQERLIALHKELANRYEAQANYGDAILEWRKVIELNPIDREAQPNIDRIKESVSTRVLSLHRQGLNLYSSNSVFDAITAFSDALRLNPEYEPSKNWLFKIKQELSQEELKERERIERLQKAELFYNRGLSYYGRKTFEEAIQEFDRALEFNPEHPNALKYKKMAEEEFEADKLGLRGLEAANTFFQKGMKNFNSGQYYAAKRDFEYALRAYPAHDESRSMLPKAEERLAIQIRPFMSNGQENYRKRIFSTAEQNFEDILKLDPDNEEAKDYLRKLKAEKQAAITFHMAEGTRTFNAKDFSKTIYHMDEVVKLDPDNSDAARMLNASKARVETEVTRIHGEALALFEQGKFNEAILTWQRALQIDSSHALSLKYLSEAESRVKQSKFGALVEDFNQKGISLFKNREYEQALGFFNKSLEIDTANATAKQYKEMTLTELEKERIQDEIAALFIGGVRNFKRRDYEAAIDNWRKVKKLDPENTLVDKYIAQAVESQKNRKIIDYINGQKYYEQGKWLLAKSSFERALVEDPSNSKARSALQNTLDRITEERQQFMLEGDKKMRAGEYIAAANEYMNAYRLDNSAESLAKRENALRAQNLLETANKYFENDSQVGLSIDPYLRLLEINPFDKGASERIAQAKERGKSLQQSWMTQAESAESAQDYQTAYAYYRSLTEIDPANTELKKGLARNRRELRNLASVPFKEGQEAMALKNYVLAIEKFNAAIAIVDDYENVQELIKTAREKQEEKKAEQAAAAARAASSSGSGNSGAARSSGSAQDALVNRGIVLYRQGKYKEAISVWNQVPKSSESYSKAQKYIARAKLKL
ncbi:MAG: tetratricopeptide repeat protein [Leptospiraceae bacterium]|nr:tetratricopeptide repeat protein [Leptospiraceae bacterium]